MAIAFEAASKNRQSDAQIRELTARAFPGKTVTEITDLNAGMCNALYKIALDDGTKVAVSNQWGKDNIKAFVILAKSFGYEIQEI